MRHLGILLCGLAFVLPVSIALYFPSVSGFTHLSFVGMALLGVAVYKGWFGTRRSTGFLLMLVPAALLIVVFLTWMTPDRWERLAAAFNPYVSPDGVGSMGVMTKELLSGAKLIGQGNIPNNYFLWLAEPYPVLYTDMLLTALIALTGWIAFAIILLALCFFIARGFVHCGRQKSSLGYFVSVSIMMTLCVQAISYIAYNLGFQFASPISLPLISFGNTATIMNLILIGFMLSVFRTGDVVMDKQYLRKI
jgi:cell division protein FtsW (lipid II flippase)